MRTNRLRAAVPVALLAGALAVGVSACGSSNTSTPAANSSSPAASSTAPLATVPNVSGVSTSVKLDPSFLAALKSLSLTPGTVGKATLDASTGVISFPITSGNVTYYKPGGPVEPYVQGILHHDGSGLSLSAGGTTVELTNFSVDPGKSILYGDVSANGTTAATQTPLFFLNGSTLQPLMKQGNDAILTGTKVSIYPSAAMLLDTTFKTTAVTPYFPVGVATITIATS
ncbi:MAG TPA: hypothetical protein VIJ71_09610 [Mycobacteriales bacterium]